MTKLDSKGATKLPYLFQSSNDMSLLTNHYFEGLLSTHQKKLQY